MWANYVYQIHSRRLCTQNYTATIWGVKNKMACINKHIIPNTHIHSIAKQCTRRHGKLFSQRHQGSQSIGGCLRTIHSFGLHKNSSFFFACHIKSLNNRLSISLLYKGWVRSKISAFFQLLLFDRSLASYQWIKWTRALCNKMLGFLNFSSIVVILTGIFAYTHCTLSHLSISCAFKPHKNVWNKPTAIAYENTIFYPSLLREKKYKVQIECNGLAYRTSEYE